KRSKQNHNTKYCPFCLFFRLALYVYEYLLHVGAQKSAQTFLSEIRWEKNITLGEPPGFLHSWWCVFWDLYCAAPERRETCEHSSEAKAFHDYSAAAAPSPVLGNIPPGDGMPVGPVPPGFFQVVDDDHYSADNPNATSYSDTVKGSLLSVHRIGDTLEINWGYTIVGSAFGSLAAKLNMWDYRRSEDNSSSRENIKLQ
ncbi:PREDICTED: single-stranded DNA-binding protein 2-like, partial [Merops nubicus]|uniref:single-stranded DNA-binding protein 2-like n=1 Tax=Merops nubicus TaxID=57421 RepID=UPI0004F0A1F0